MRIGLDVKTWTIGNPLPDGQGGFGRVRDAHDEAGTVAVAKFVPKDPGAERELLMGDSIKAARCRNVVPVLDSGEHEDQWVIVMPKASESLSHHLEAAGGPLPPDEVVEILHDIATALADLAGEIVHRDLKPQNVLRLDGKWCLADFGIARYSEATTAGDTRKGFLSRLYAAPEQWQYEQATTATDVYAFGVIGHQLLSGRPPFLGPDFRGQHLTEPPPKLTVGTDRLRTLVGECLYKARETRPTPAQILARLASAAEEPASRGLAKLARANQAETERRATEQAAAIKAQERHLTRAQMFDAAKQAYEPIPSALLSAIQQEAPVANVERGVGHGTMEFVATLQTGRLGISQPIQPAPNWAGPFTVVAYAVVTVNLTQRNRYGHEGRSHSLWFCDAQEEGRYGWYETAFMNFALSGQARSVEPYSLEPSQGAAALSGVIGTVQLAWPFTEVDRSDPAEFVDRWLGWFADAASGQLSRPSMMPEKDPSGSWRRS